MSGFIERLDDLAGTGGGHAVVFWLERGAFAFLALMVLAAPHSIAATQTAWLTGMFLWLVSVVIRRIRSKVGTKQGESSSQLSTRRALDLSLWAFFVWAVVTAFTSYAPDISMDKLRGVSVFLIFYFVVHNVRSLRAVYFVVFVLILSCMVNVVWMPVQRLIGRGVEIHGVTPNSPLAKAALRDGDTLLEANGVKLKTPEQLADAIQQNEETKVKYYRPDFELVADVYRSNLLGGSSAAERLGFESWKKSRNWRSRGFYGHYTTYAEVLQLIGSLVMGLLVSLAAAKWIVKPERRGDANKGEKGRHGEREIRRDTAFKKDLGLPRRRVSVSKGLLFSLLGFCLAAMCLALLLTVTRASQLAFLVSAAVIVLFGLGRKWLFAAAAIGLPLALIGLFFLQQSRQVGFFDQKDDSIRWRQTVWLEGFELWTENPRHFLLGVGMDSVKRFAPEWDLFDHGRLPMGHFHSTPLNLVVERGLPALILWLIVLAIYVQILWRGLTPSEVPHSAFNTPHSRKPVATAPGSDLRLRHADWISKGLLLGCIGGLAGFFISGLVHYNLGDQEVAMVFFLLMGVGIRISELSSPLPETDPSAASSVKYRMAA